MVILIDMDDVLEQDIEGWTACVNEKYGTSVRPEEVRDWDMSLAFPMLTREQVNSVVQTDDFWDHVPPKPGAAETVRKLLEDGHEIYVVTASGYRTLAAKMDRCLFRYFPEITWDHVIIANHKQMIRGDVLIDDGPHNLKDGRFHRLLFEAGHNADFDEASIGAVRVRNWDEVYAEICRLDGRQGRPAEKKGAFSGGAVSDNAHGIC